MESKKYPIGGYAPGNYTCKCYICKQEFQGDKRSVQCESCAVKEFRELLKPYEQPGPRWVKASERVSDKHSSELHWRFSHNKRPISSPFHISDGQLVQEYSNTRSVYALREIEWLDESAAAISQDAHEKEIIMQAFDKVRQIFVGRQWIMEGRGSYPYNDDRYKEEVRYMYDEFDQVVKDTWANIKSKSVDYKRAIIAEYLESAAGREDAVEFAEWVANNYSWEYDPMSDEYQWLEANNFYTTAELYELFKQQKEK